MFPTGLFTSVFPLRRSSLVCLVVIGIVFLLNSQSEIYGIRLDPESIPVPLSCEAFDSIPLVHGVPNNSGAELQAYKYISKAGLWEEAHATSRNRNPRLLPYDLTRVPIPPTATNPHGYINADYIGAKCFDGPNQILPKLGIEGLLVASEGPRETPESTSDFLRMVLNVKPKIVVALATPRTGKVSQYWPTSSGERLTITEDLWVDLLPFFENANSNLRRPVVSLDAKGGVLQNLDPKSHDSTDQEIIDPADETEPLLWKYAIGTFATIRKIRVTYAPASGELVSHTVYHVVYEDWADLSPPSEEEFTTVLRLVQYLFLVPTLPHGSAVARIVQQQMQHSARDSWEDYIGRRMQASAAPRTDPQAEAMVPGESADSPGRLMRASDRRPLDAAEPTARGVELAWKGEESAASTGGSSAVAVSSATAVVHCAGGAGRTGTFLLAFYATEWIHSWLGSREGRLPIDYLVPPRRRVAGASVAAPPRNLARWWADNARDGEDVEDEFGSGFETEESGSIDSADLEVLRSSTGDILEDVDDDILKCEAISMLPSPLSRQSREFLLGILHNGLHGLRNCRPHLVETSRQFTFVYRLLSDAFGPHLNRFFFLNQK
eukprot:Rmarinus@m.8422